MSLKDDDRMLLVKMQMEKSRSDMHTAEVLVGENMYAVAAGRLYYAVFHAVCALLIHDNIRIKSHKGAYTMFCLSYVNTGRLPRMYGKWYKDLENMREESDYNCFYDVSLEDVQSWISPAKEMIETIAEMIKDEKQKKQK